MSELRTALTTDSTPSHVVIAVDLGRSALEVARNGEVFADRIPHVVGTIISTFKHILETRAAEALELHSAVLSELVMRSAAPDQVDEAHHRIWNPAIVVSLVVVNAPATGTGAPPAPQNEQQEATTADKHDCVVSPLDTASSGSSSELGSMMLPADVSYAGTSDTSKGSSIVPFFLRQDVRQWNEDELTAVVGNRLRQCERQYRSGDCHNWPYGSVTNTMESMLNACPIDAPECHSLILVSNFAVSGCAESIARLDSVAMRKSVIITVVSLNRFLVWDSPHLIPLADFLSAIGGSVFSHRHA